MSLLSGVSSQSPGRLLLPWPAWVWTASSVSGYSSHLFLCAHCARVLQVVSALLFANLLRPSEPSLQRPPSLHASCFLICPYSLPLLLTMFEAYQLSQGGPQTICVRPSVGALHRHRDHRDDGRHSALAECGSTHSCAWPLRN